MTPSFWFGKRVFITGHTGFKGSWLSLWLQSLGADVTGYALRPPTNPSLFDEANVCEGMNSIHGDVRDLEELKRAVLESSPEVVIHLAAQSLVRNSYNNPVETYATNVLGTVHLLEAIRVTPGIKAAVIVTTDKCYENRNWVWGYRESDSLGGYDPYSSSKACAELVCSAYNTSFFNAHHYADHGVAVATARAGNVIGGGDWATDRLIPDIVAAFEQGKPLSVRNPSAIRPWQHVLEPLRGYLMLAEKLVHEGPVYAQGWNFGPNVDDVKPVSWIVDQMATRWGRGVSWNLDLKEQPHEAIHLKLDISKARDLLGWRPELGLSEALDLVVDWFVQRQSGANARIITEQQISNYQESMAAQSP